MVDIPAHIVFIIPQIIDCSSIITKISSTSEASEQGCRHHLLNEQLLHIFHHCHPFLIYRMNTSWVSGQLGWGDFVLYSIHKEIIINIDCINQHHFPSRNLENCYSQMEVGFSAAIFKQYSPTIIELVSRHVYSLHLPFSLPLRLESNHLAFRIPSALS